MTPARADQLAAPLRECPLLFSLSARRAAASQDPPLRSAGHRGTACSGDSPPATWRPCWAVLVVWLGPPENPSRETNTVSVHGKLTMST
jgi:hypothetical protein